MKIKIWDNYTRIFHISQLILLALLWYSADNADFELHFQCGFILAGLWLSRLIWGFVGSDNSRFINFVKSPFAVINAWKNNDIAKPHAGHNPVGGYMVIALLAVIGVQIFTGLFATDDVLAEGPLYAFFSDDLIESMDSLHHSNFDVLLILAGIHAVAGILHVLRGDNVISAIITGRKKSNLAVENKFRSSFIALAIWLIAGALIYYFGMQYASY